jgi:hypothetical protein
MSEVSVMPLGLLPGSIQQAFIEADRRSHMSEQIDRMSVCQVSLDLFRKSA